MARVSIPQRALVVKVVEEAPNVKTIYVRIPHFPKPAPGQFCMLCTRFGEIPISVSKIERRGESLVLGYTVRAVGTVSRYVVDSVAPGMFIGVKGPFGRGWPIDRVKGTNILVVAGGIGLAPLRPLIEYVMERRDEYGELTILYGARSPRDMLYKTELEEYRSIPNTRVLLSIDRPFNGWKGYVGFVTDLIDRVERLAGENTSVFICGPEVMMRVAVKKLIAKGFRKDSIFLSLERRMRCGYGICGSCQFGHFFVCKDGPVFSYHEIEDYLWVEGI